MSFTSVAHSLLLLWLHSDMHSKNVAVCYVTQSPKALCSCYSLSPLTSDCLFLHWCFWSVDPVQCARPISEARLQWCEAISVLLMHYYKCVRECLLQSGFYAEICHRNFKYNKLFLQHVFTLLADTYPNYTVYKVNPHPSSLILPCVYMRVLASVHECGGFEALQYLYQQCNKINKHIHNPPQKH
jgi:hypothetical protein